MRNPTDRPPVSYVLAGEWPDALLLPDAPPTAHAGQELALALRALMRTRGLSARALAQRAGTTHPTILRILGGTGLVDMRTVFLLEVTLQAPLWPRRLYADFTPPGTSP
ncbi:helix-turn-helix domain-containing protein [Streptomyces purpureus]|uniref:HTH cro/C1-type domain-containing protein n=1 Tax=Streptomyces purpureus TaxID=1951 RepID=A0A918GYL3_9ACTN|nr:helix-turn-helix transcriptional regulator [Streptomyces purpureus]GGT19113.1 hypothetical protein GCM10014713_10090 [Streptomyces purpureus]